MGKAVGSQISKNPGPEVEIVAASSTLLKASIVATFVQMLFLSGDNMSQPERMKRISTQIAQDIEKGDFAAAAEDIKRWNTDRRNEYDRIVFRYLSTGEFNKIYEADDGGSFLLPIDARGTYGAGKYITPDFYQESKVAKDRLALPSAPQMAIWTFESLILETKVPLGRGVYNHVYRTLDGKGGGREAVIYQAFPVQGGFTLK